MINATTLKKLFIFLLINFAALGLGSYLMGEGPQSNWYKSLKFPPWMPPGWLFGVAWTTIMICFSIYMALLWDRLAPNRFLLVFTIQWVLNVAWNPVFFAYHLDLLGLAIIIMLTIVVHYMFLKFWKVLGFKSLLLAPYTIWLLIATSLNLYISLNN